LEIRPISERRAAAKEQSGDHYAQRRKDVIRAAAEVFRSKGVAATSMKDVADAANINRASVYYYVESKEELYEAVVLDAVERNIADAESLVRSRIDPREKLERLVRLLLKSFADNYPQMYVFIQERTGEKASPVIRELQKRFDNSLTKVIEQGVKRGTFRPDVSPRVATFALLGMINWTHRWYDPTGQLTPQELGDQFMLLLERGLVAADRT
jgi:AcrR family transcriptional regulator